MLEDTNVFNLQEFKFILNFCKGMYQNVIPVSKTYADKENHFEVFFFKVSKEV